MSESIELGRVAREKRVACSYRIEPTESGDFFPSDNGWRSYYEQSRTLSRKRQYVLHVDIAAFYNQIYHHRLQGALEGVGITAERSANIERFLGQFTARQSQGIPVGPAASHVLAEACMNDVDQYLMDENYEFTRYVDNFRVFVDDRRTAIQALHDLIQYLHSAHRLAIQDSKTHFEPTADFMSSRLEDPETKEDERRERVIEDLIEEHAREQRVFGDRVGRSRRRGPAGAAQCVERAIRRSSAACSNTIRDGTTCAAPGQIHAIPSSVSGNDGETRISSPCISGRMSLCSGDCSH